MLSALCTVPNGVVSMSDIIPGLVQTSTNLGTIRTEGGTVRTSHAIRSSVNDEKEALAAAIGSVYKAHGFVSKRHSDYPAWEYKEQSRLREVVSAASKELFGSPLKEEAIHAGLECGIFCGKLPNLDCISIGPDIFDIHSTDETLDKKSAERVFSLLIRSLERLAKI